MNPLVLPGSGGVPPAWSLPWQQKIRRQASGALNRKTKVTAEAALFCFCLLSPAVGLAETATTDRASRLVSQGHFAEASAVLSTALNKTDLSASQRDKLEFELDRLRRIKLDFPYTETKLFIELKKSIRSLAQEEYQQWVRENRFDSRDIDGQRFFMVASVSNLFFRYPELSERRITPRNNAALEARHLEICRAIKQAALAAKRPYVLPQRFRITMTVTADAQAAPEGEIIRAWLPVPRHYPFQNGFELITSSSTPRHLDDEQSSARSIYLEQPAIKDKSTEFRIQYEYTTSGVWFDLLPGEIRPIDSHDQALNEFTREAPHVLFTSDIRALSEQIAAGETNPYLKAKKFYDWIADNIKYSFATEYSTVDNLSEYCLGHRYGDCGQEALLFITLCRLNGIPARWQSGWTIFPGAKSNHDWTEIYLAPYGWIPVDPYMGIYATRYATSLKPEQRRELRDFYFGGLDQYRMIANSDHNQILKPSKHTMRSDDVDFQRGELERGNQNIYFDQFSYELTAKELPRVPGKVE